MWKRRGTRGGYATMSALVLLGCLAGGFGVAPHPALTRGEPSAGSAPATLPAEPALPIPARPELAMSPGAPGFASTGPRVQAARGAAESQSVRWLEFAALLTVLGVLGFRHGVLPPLAVRGVPTVDASDRARRLGQGVLALYGLAALARLYSQSAIVHGQSGALTQDAVLALVTRTAWGVGWSAGVIGSLMLFLGWAISRRTVTIGTPLALTGAFGMVIAPALSGHAAASRHFIWSVTLDALHVAAAGIWTGGLLIVVLCGIPAMLRLEGGNRHAAVSALVNSFHPIALFCAPLAVVSGAGLAWIRLGSAQALWGTAYGRTLLVKLALAIGLVLLASYNAARARRRLGPADGVATARFRLSATLEIAVSAAVVAVTTFLVVTSMPSEIAP